MDVFIYDMFMCFCMLAFMHVYMCGLLGLCFDCIVLNCIVGYGGGIY